jgi:hypothetical protein
MVRFVEYASANFRKVRESAGINDDEYAEAFEVRDFHFAQEFALDIVPSPP